MSDAIVARAEESAVPIHLLEPEETGAALAALSPGHRAQAEIAKFAGKAGQAAVLTGAGGVERVLAGRGSGEAMALRALPARLPPGLYRFEPHPAPAAAATVTLAWALGAYRFDRYRQHGEPLARLLASGGLDFEAVRAAAHACALARDMINTPAADMGPRQIETIAREVANAYGASIVVIEGEALKEAGYPAVHAVGRAAASDRGPRMIEIAWGEAGRPLVVLVGKGVVFDTGGLDIKDSSGMRLMKKDMGGAAHALALGRMVMAAGLPVRLAVLLPVAENAISGEAMRPGDVIASRKGLSIEIGNTDAEGRLVLADALARAGELAPDLTIDLATLTGAARAALGPELPPFFTADEDLAAAIASAARDAEDPVWRLPLWASYDASLDSDIADVKNDPDGWAQAGAVTAALFLQRFAPPGPWVHLDIFAWNSRNRPGWPVGAEAQAIRGLFLMLQRRYG